MHALHPPNKTGVGTVINVLFGFVLRVCGTDRLFAGKRLDKIHCVLVQKPGIPSQRWSNTHVSSSLLLPRTDVLRRLTGTGRGHSSSEDATDPEGMEKNF